MKSIKEFVAQFGVPFPYPDADVVEVSRNFFLTTDAQREQIKELKRDVFAIGLPLGFQRKEFMPSLVLLDEIAKSTTQTVTVNEKAEWLFICGRDVFKEGVVSSSAVHGQLVIVLNSRKECLGYGKMVNRNKILVESMLDRGDFLRRERNLR